MPSGGYIPAHPLCWRCRSTGLFQHWSVTSFVVVSFFFYFFRLPNYASLCAHLLAVRHVGRHTHALMLLVFAALPTRAKRSRKTIQAIALEEANEADVDRRSGVGRRRRENPAVVAGEVAQHEATEASRREEGDEEEKPHTPYWRVACADLECCLLLSVGLALLCLAWFLLVNFGGVANRYIWISCLFAPFGTAGVCSSDRCSPCLLAHLSVCPPLRCLVIYRGSASLCGVTIQHLATVCALPFLHLPCQRRGLDWPGSHHHQRWFARLQYRH